MTFAIFPFGERVESSPDRWIEWFARTKRPGYKACWQLLEWGCPRRELLEVLVSMYLLPVSHARTLASLGDLHTALVQAGRALAELRQTAAVSLRLLPAPSLAWGLELGALRRAVAAYEKRVQSVDRLEDAGETLVRKQLTAMVLKFTGRPHDREIGSIVAELLGRAVKAPAAAQEQWRKRHLPTVRARDRRLAKAKPRTPVRDND